MIGRGYKPVGRDFPVFLHPDTHEEYALARTERKSGRGHQGFHIPRGSWRDDRGGSRAPRPDNQRDGPRRVRRARRSLPAASRSGRTDIAPRQSGIRRGSAARPARRPLCRTIRFRRCRGNRIADARHRRQRGARRAIARARVARVLARPDGADALANAGRASALRRACAQSRPRSTRCSRARDPEPSPTQASRSRPHSIAARGVRPRSLPIQFGIIGRRLGIDAIQSLSARIRAANDCRDAALIAARYASAARKRRRPRHGPRRGPRRRPRRPAARTSARTNGSRCSLASTRCAGRSGSTSWQGCWVRTHKGTRPGESKAGSAPLPKCSDRSTTAPSPGTTRTSPIGSVRCGSMRCRRGWTWSAGAQPLEGSACLPL